MKKEFILNLVHFIDADSQFHIFLFTQTPLPFIFFSTQPWSAMIFSWPNYFLFGPTSTINK